MNRVIAVRCRAALFRSGVRRISETPNRNKLWREHGTEATGAWNWVLGKRKPKEIPTITPGPQLSLKETLNSSVSVQKSSSVSSELVAPEHPLQALQRLNVINPIVTYVILFTKCVSVYFTKFWTVSYCASSKEMRIIFGEFVLLFAVPLPILRTTGLNQQLSKQQMPFNTLRQLLRPRL